MKLSIILCSMLLLGCTNFGNNFDRTIHQEAKSEEKVQTAMAESRRTESPQPVTIHVTASGNANVNAAIPDLKPQKSDVGLQKSMMSDSWADTSISEAWSQVSMWFYLGLAAAAFLLVRALKQFESTTTGRALGALGETLRYKLQETDRSDPEHRVLTSILHEINGRTGKRK